ncbi:hypothetical protein [Sporanaerobacter sp. PP17-6a]|uniref:hypothetical protein n=1 Tax=Sporanaerobacter sp. PP17-6a TaxID=1891289 RepID=UPI001F30305F|nr:hypothetical protein [Sporanaerobacter sp. PP17-6a]
MYGINEATAASAEKITEEIISDFFVAASSSSLGIPVLGFAVTLFFCFMTYPLFFLILLLSEIE